MCDCSDDDDEKKSDDGDPEMVTLFKTCPEPFTSGGDIIIQDSMNLKDIRQDLAELNHFLESDSSDTTVPCDAQKKLSPHLDSISTESSRMYEFIDRKECEEIGEGEESMAEEMKRAMTVPKVCFDPWSQFREDEEEAEEEGKDIECTLAIIKPEALMYKKEIKRRIYEEGFEIYQSRWLQLTPEQASDFYAENYGQLYFPHLVAYMSSNPILVLVLAKQNAVAEWKFIIGPTRVIEARLYFPDSIRGQYGRKGDDFKNAVHGSANHKEAEREIHFFFPHMILEPILTGDDAVHYLEEVINPLLTEALSLCCKLKPAEPILWLANWLLLNNPNKPKYPENLVLISPN